MLSPVRLLLFSAALGVLLSSVSIVSAAEPPKKIHAIKPPIADSTLTRHKVVYLDFWASWCVPCRQSFPFMNSLKTKYGDQGLEIIAINMDKDRSAAAEFLAQTKPSFTIRYDSAGALAKKFDLQAMPSSYLYDRSGELKESHRGFVAADTSKIEASIRKLLEGTGK